MTAVSPPPATISSPEQSKPITWRYWCMRLTSCPVPFLPAKTPVIGGRSMIEVICTLLLFAMAVALALPSYEGAGKIGDKLMAATTVLGLRNNLLNVLFGISYERALFWHKVMGCATIVMILIHTLCGINPSGTILITTMLAMASTYVIKNQSFPKAFELFYYVHLIGMVILCIMGLFHGAPFTAFSAILWAADLILRSCIQSKTIKATVEELPAQVIKLTFDGQIKYHAGQYAFLRIPVVNAIEFHPFSYSSTPLDKSVTIHIRELGDWSRRLGDLARAHKKATPDTPLIVDVAVDGPYGNPMINLHGPEYEVFLLISGGIGITPNQSFYNDLIRQNESGRHIRKVYFVWSVKDKALIDTMSADMLESKKLLNGDQTPLSFQPPMTGAGTNVSNSKPLVGDYVFENRFYLTSVRNEEQFRQANIRPEEQPWLTFGRPDIRALFKEISDALINDQKSSSETGRSVPRVAVSVCGPPTLVADVQDSCRLSKGGRVVFDCHAEVFDM